MTSNPNKENKPWYDQVWLVVLLLVVFFPVGLYALWKNGIWTKQTKWIITGILALVILANMDSFSADGGRSTEECKDDIGAYEYGREMHTWVTMNSWLSSGASNISLNEAITKSSDALGLEPPYKAEDPCVKRGFRDASEGKESPYK